MGDLMSLAERLVGVIWKRFERIPSVSAQISHQKQAVEVSIEAEKVARSSLEDPQAKAMLAKRLSANASSIDTARTALSRRCDYVSNRAYRLLSAVDDDTPVAPVAQHLEQLFSQEEALGRMPLDQAFRYLAEIEPRLLSMKQQMIKEPTDTEHSSRLTTSTHRALVDLVGVNADRDRTLIGTNLAASIVRQYLEIRGGVTTLGSIDVPYFDAPLRICVRA